MQYLVYLKRSLTRRPARHLTVFVIMTCALVLPLLFSIYRDSMEHGERLQLLDMTKGETFHVKNAREEDCAIFADVDGLSEPRFEAGVIYLRVLDDAQWQDKGAVGHYADLLTQKMEQAGVDDRMWISCQDYYLAHGVYLDASAQEGSRSIQVFSVLVMVLSALVIRSAYKSHLRRFRSDVGVLCSCGASDGQIRILFLVEFTFLFALSAVSAVFLSAAVMKLLFSAYMEISGEGRLSWVIFRMDPRNTALCVAVFGVMLLMTLWGTLRGNGRQSLRSMIREQPLQVKGRKRKKLPMKGTPEKSLSGLWRQRTHGVYRSCFYTSVFVMTPFLFLIGFFTIVIRNMEQPLDYELDVRTTNVSLWGGFTQEDVDFVKGLQNIDHAVFLQELPAEFYARPSEGEGLYVDRIRIKLVDPRLHGQTEEALRLRFSGIAHQVDDDQYGVELSYKVSKGLYLMLLFLFCASLLFLLVILYMKLYEYVDDCQGTIRTLSAIGAPKDVVRASFLRQAAGAALAAVVTFTVAGTALVHVAAFAGGQEFSAGVPLVAACAAAGTLTVAGYLLPVQNRLKQVLRAYN